jgi:hypothetical protein
MYRQHRVPTNVAKQANWLPALLMQHHIIIYKFLKLSMHQPSILLMSVVIPLRNNAPHVQAASSTCQCSNASKLASSAAYAALHNNIQVCGITEASTIYFINACGDYL